MHNMKNQPLKINGVVHAGQGGKEGGELPTSCEKSMLSRSRRMASSS